MKLIEIQSLVAQFGAKSEISNPSHHTVLWGVAPTGDIHIGYLPFIAILKELKSKGIRVIIFIGDFHAYFDDCKTEFGEISDRNVYYREVFYKFGFQESEVISANDIYLKSDYVNLLFKFSNYLPYSDLLEYAGVTLRHHSDKDYRFGDLLYVATQILDIEFFDVDLLLCGTDESGIYKLGLPILKRYSGREVDYFYLKMFPGVISKEMHASDDERNKISVHESLDSITMKLNNNTMLLDAVKDYLLPLFGFKNVNSLKCISETLYKICHESI